MDLLFSQYELEIAYQADGQVQKVVELLERVVEVQEKMLLPEHPGRLASQHELAGAYPTGDDIIQWLMTGILLLGVIIPDFYIGTNNRSSKRQQRDLRYQALPLQPGLGGGPTKTLIALLKRSHATSTPYYKPHKCDAISHP